MCVLFLQVLYLSNWEVGGDLAVITVLLAFYDAEVGSRFLIQQSTP